MAKPKVTVSSAIVMRGNATATARAATDRSAVLPSISTPPVFKTGLIRPVRRACRESLRRPLALRRQLGEDGVGLALPAIPLDRAQRGVMALLAVGHAGIVDQRHEEAEVAAVAHGGLDALIGQQSHRQ